MFNTTSVRTSVSTTNNNNQTVIIEAPKEEFAGKEFFFWKVLLTGTKKHLCYCNNEYCSANHNSTENINRTITVKTVCAQDAVNRVRKEIIEKEYKNSANKERNTYHYPFEKTTSETIHDIKIESCIKMPDEEWV